MSKEIYTKLQDEYLNPGTDEYRTAQKIRERTAGNKKCWPFFHAYKYIGLGNGRRDYFGHEKWGLRIEMCKKCGKINKSKFDPYW